MRTTFVMVLALVGTACGPVGAGTSAEVSQRLDALVAAADEHQAAAAQTTDDAACQAEVARYDAQAQPLLDELAGLTMSGHCRCCGDRGFARSLDAEVTALHEHVAQTCQAAPADRPAMVEHHCAGMRQFAMGAPR